MKLCLKYYWFLFSGHGVQRQSKMFIDDAIMLVFIQWWALIITYVLVVTTSCLFLITSGVAFIQKMGIPTFLSLLSLKSGSMILQLQKVGYTYSTKLHMWSYLLAHYFQCSNYCLLPLNTFSQLISLERMKFNSCWKWKVWQMNDCIYTVSQKNGARILCLITLTSVDRF